MNKPSPHPQGPPGRLPPRWADRLLSWLTPAELLEELQGDLQEQFAQRVDQVGPRWARFWYGLEALKVIRPFYLRRRVASLAQGRRVFSAKRLDSPPRFFTPQYASQPLINPNMIRNYLKIAWRNLVSNRLYSFINILGLAMGMGVAILIGLWMDDELSFNKRFAHYDHIAQVMQNQTYNGVIQTWPTLPVPLAQELRQQYGNDFKQVTLSSWPEGHLLYVGNKVLSKTGRFMEPQAPMLFSLTMRQGSLDGLRDPYSILLAESTAKAFFGQANPVGKLLKIDNKYALTVTGVYQDFPANSAFAQVDFLSPWALKLINEKWITEMENPWGTNGWMVYVQLADQADLAKLSAKIKDAKRRRVHADEQKFKPQLFLHPMSRWHLYGEFTNGLNTGGRIEFVWLFGLIGGFVLLLACINFMNLSTARSEKRAKEVGIRKAIGSQRIQLIAQFFSESFLVVGFAFLLSLLAVQLILPAFNQVADKRVAILWDSPWFWLLSAGFSLLTGLLAGSYPAFYLSSFQAIKVLKGTFRLGRLAALPRQVLVVIQFTVSVTLIIGTILVFRQIQFAKNRPLGYDQTGLISFPIIDGAIHTHFGAIQEELTKAGAVVNMAESSGPVTGVWATNGGFDWRGKDPSLALDFPNTAVSTDYGQTVGWTFREGRDFSRAFPSDSMAFVINEAAAKFMGFKHPVGETIKWDGRPYIVIGVIKDMLMESPYQPVKPSLFNTSNSHESFVILKLNPRSSSHESLQRIDSVVKKYAPAIPFDFQFVDQEYAKKFGDEERIGRLASFFAVLTIVISCLGLFGLASFVAEQRTKEIGVRKVLGASVVNLWVLQSKGFLGLVGIAFGLASLIAYYFLDTWLQHYSYHTELSWWIFAASGLGAC